MSLVRLVFLLPFVSLAGCTALRGSPSPVIPVKESVALLADYRIDVAIKNFRSSDPQDRMNMAPQQYRDMVISLYLNAIDARYFAFRRDVSAQGRGGALAADLAVLGLASGASVIDGWATELSAGAAAVAGGKAVIDKNVYFDKALPALLAAMDAQRARVRTQIALNVRRDANQYPLETAFGDLAAYEGAASLDRAVDTITTAAAEQRQEETKRYDKAIRACEGEDDLVDNRQRIMKFVSARAAAKDVATLDAMAKQMGLAGGDDEAAIRQDIRDALISNYCTNDALAELIRSVAAEQWGTSI